MNQRNLFKIIALPVCLLAFGLASCEKDEAVTPPDSGGEQVLPGTAGEVTEAVTTEGGYSLSYRSCIALPEGGSAEVDLTASLPASGTTTEEIVSNWDYAEEENGFIITDSLLVYTVSYGTFELTFEFPYETAQYDGTDVPEYRFEIKDKGGKFELIDSKERDGKAYALREYTHTVEAVFGGKSYEVSKSILLMRELGPANEPYLLSSIAESCKMEEVVMDGVTYIFTVNQIWSDKQSKSMEYYIVPGVWIDEKTTHLPEISNYADDLYIKNTTLNEGIRTHSNYTYDGLISYFRTTQSYLVEFNYFVLEYEFCHDDVIYDDGVLVYKDFPDIKFTDFENSFTFEKEGEVYDDGNGPCQNYHLIHTLVGRGVDADPDTATTDLIVKVRL